MRSRSRLLFLFFFGWMLPASTVSAEVEQRLALVIANYAYNAGGSTVSPLKGPDKDAEIVARALRGVGFEVTEVDNLGKAAFDSNVARHLRRVKASTNPVSLIYFSGNALQFQNKNYLAPTDFRLTLRGPEDTRGEITSADNLVSFEAMVEQIVDANSKGANFLIVDAQMSGIIGTGATRAGLSKGFEAERNEDIRRLVNSVKPIAVLMAALNTPALDSSGDDGASPFSTSFAEQLREPGVSWLVTFRNIVNATISRTQGRQQPAIITGLKKDFQFVKGAPRLDYRGRVSWVPIQDEAGKDVRTYDESHALLIGVGTYQHKAWSPLPGVARDLDTVESVLAERHGFKVTRVKDPTSDALQQALKSFLKVEGAKENVRLLIYFAGHGTTTDNHGRKLGWFVPADAPGTDALQEFAMTALSMRRIEELSEIIRSKHVLWVFDSCFSGSVFSMRSRAQSMTPFEKSLLALPVRQIITSGSEKQEVPDESVFARLFVKALRGEPDARITGSDILTGRQLGLWLQQEVTNYSSQKQTPQYGAINIQGLDKGDLIFRIERPEARP